MATTVVAEPVESAEPAMGSAQQAAEEEGLTFSATPGPGYSEGGDVYEPDGAPQKPPLGSHVCGSASGAQEEAQRSSRRAKAVAVSIWPGETGEH
jgi:hypothetical protein